MGSEGVSFTQGGVKPHKLDHPVSKNGLSSFS
jgi:hypothetical protein